MGQILGQSFLVCAYGYFIDPGGAFVFQTSVCIVWKGQIIGQSYLVCAYGYVIDPGGAFVFQTSVCIVWKGQIIGQSYLVCAYGYVIDPGGAFVFQTSVYVCRMTNISKVATDSVWVIGNPLMSGDKCNFLVKTVGELCLSNEDRNEVTREGTPLYNVGPSYLSRVSVSNYSVDWFARDKENKMFMNSQSIHY
jgi:hypothetical protein